MDNYYLIQCPHIMLTIILISYTMLNLFLFFRIDLIYLKKMMLILNLMIT